MIGCILAVVALVDCFVAGKNNPYYGVHDERNTFSMWRTDTDMWSAIEVIMDGNRRYFQHSSSEKCNNSLVLLKKPENYTREVELLHQLSQHEEAILAISRAYLTLGGQEEEDPSNNLGALQMARLILYMYFGEDRQFQEYGSLMGGVYRAMGNFYDRGSRRSSTLAYYYKISNYIEGCRRDNLSKHASVLSVARRSLHRKSRTHPGLVVGLAHMRNAQVYLHNYVKMMSRICDRIILLDNNSSDASVQEATHLSRRYPIEKIIQINTTFGAFDELRMKQVLLQEGRSIGGTHFVMVDLDEVFSWGLLKGKLLQRLVKKLTPGEMLTLPWVHLWQGADFYRFDNGRGFQIHKRRQCVAWADRPGLDWCNLKNCTTRMHVPRCPDIHARDQERKVIQISGMSNVLMHLRYVEDPGSTVIKQGWYMMKERWMHPRKNSKKIIDFYESAIMGNEIILEPVPHGWISGYGGDFMNMVEKIQDGNSTWREREMVFMYSFNQTLFSGLGIEKYVELAQKRLQGCSLSCLESIFPNGPSKYSKPDEELVEFSRRYDVQTRVFLSRSSHLTKGWNLVAADILEAKGLQNFSQKLKRMSMQ